MLTKIAMTVLAGAMATTALTGTASAHEGRAVVVVRPWVRTRVRTMDSRTKARASQAPRARGSRRRKSFWGFGMTNGQEQRHYALPPA